MSEVSAPQLIVVRVMPTAEQRQQLEQDLIRHGRAVHETIGPADAFVTFAETGRTLPRWCLEVPLLNRSMWDSVRLKPLGDGLWRGRP